MDYKEELRKIDKLLSDQSYNIIIRNVGWLFEIAMKEIYKKQIDFFETNISNEILSKEYQKLLAKQNDMFDDFDIEKATFFQIIKLFHESNFNQLIELRINKPLTFGYDIPLHRIRKLRNKVTHDKEINVLRDTAYRFISYLKIYLKETELVDEDVVVGENRCYSCYRLIDRHWNYCPDCGSDLSFKCKSCGLELKSTWAVCPKCSTPREGVKVSDPDAVYGYYCQAVWSDAFLNREEILFLKKKKRELGLNDEKSKKIENMYAPEKAVRFRDVVESCLVDGKIDDAEKEYLRKKAEELMLNHEMANSIFLACVNSIIGEPLFVE
jgi:RNA polymerase subunit RPABC4/transcription elongation factor Spt4